MKQEIIRLDQLTMGTIKYSDITLLQEKETEIIWRYTYIAFSDLDTGDKIAITFAGEIMETYPMQITQVEQIQLLDDEL